ncbi:MAG: hypothetical protein CL931_10495 [Deltaproteobacteria bacterium]|nr:hypothetical protein [Deltaproteobacteria bacterium]
MRPALLLVLASLLLSSTALGCRGEGGPAGLLPGGRLAGEDAGLPEDWGFAGDAGTIQLETNPEAPYSVNLAYTVIDGRLYINAGGTETRWAVHIAADPRVRLRREDQLYALRARRVTEAAEIETFAEAWTSQSFFRRDPRQYEEIWLYEMQPR